jgi:zinc transporter 1/2/3
VVRLQPHSPISSFTPAASVWSNIPLSALHAELQRRQEAGERPACGSSASKHAYNTPLHVFALFLILILSTAACSFPVVVRRFPNLPVPSYALFLSRHFGTGVLIATAFVHLLPTAYTSLTDPCLPPFWTEVYPAMPGFIAMVSVMVVVAIEMFFALKGASHSHAVDLDGLREEGGQRKRPGHHRTESFRPFRHAPLGQGASYGQDGIPMTSPSRPYADDPGTPGSVLDKPLPPEPPRDSDDDSDLDLDELDPQADPDTLRTNTYIPIATLDTRTTNMPVPMTGRRQLQQTQMSSDSSSNACSLKLASYSTVCSSVLHYPSQLDQPSSSS